MIFKLNRGSNHEVFCYTVKKIKELFKDTEVYINFSYLGKNFKVYSKERHFNYVKKNIKGKIMCSFEMCTRQNDPNFSLYLIKDNLLTKEIKDELEKDYLPKLYNFYLKKLNDNCIIATTNLMLIELRNGKLKLHEI